MTVRVARRLFGLPLRLIAAALAAAVICLSTAALCAEISPFPDLEPIRQVLDRVGRVAADGDIADIQQVIVDTGALACVEERIATLTGRAIDAIRTAPITAEACDALAELAVYVAERNA